MKTYYISNIPPAALIVSEGDGPQLISNDDPQVTVWLGLSNAVTSAVPLEAFPLAPGASLSVDGKADVFAIADQSATNVVQVLIAAGGMSFFQPISQLVIQGSQAGVFIYSPIPGLGNLIGSWSSASFIDQYGNVIPQGINVNQGALVGVGITNSQIIASTLAQCVLNGPQIADAAISGGICTETTIVFDSTGGSLTMYSSTTTSVTYAANGQYDFIVPAGVTQARIQAWGAGAGAGGGNGTTGGAGAGAGEYAEEPNYGLTPGADIVVIVGNGGTGGATNVGGGDGQDTTVDGSGVVAHGGNGDFGTTGGAGGTGSTNTIHFNGGKGGNSVTGQGTGGGGGSSAGPTGAGHNGGNATAGAGGAGGTAVSGGGAGGAGALAAANGANGTAPGGAGGGAGSASGVTSGSKTYTPTHTYSYHGSEVGNTLRATDNSIWQGVYSGGLGVDGDEYGFALFNGAQIRSDLAGQTIDKVTVTVYCQHSWYNSGMTAVFGYTSQSSFGATGTSPGPHANIYNAHIAENSRQTYDLTSRLASVIATSNFNALQLGPAKAVPGHTTDLNMYGYFAGKNTGSPPNITVSYHSGAGAQQAGNGQDGKVIITYVSSSVLVGAASPVAMTDSAGNAMAVGWTGPVTGIEPGSNPATLATWHTTPGYLNSWGAAGAVSTNDLKFKFEANGKVAVYARLANSAGGIAGSSTIGTLPANLPKPSRDCPVYSYVHASATPFAAGSGFILVRSSGNIDFFGSMSTAQTLEIDGEYHTDLP